MIEQKQPGKWYHSFWGVLIILGTVGPFGLYFLWKSSSFSKTAKWFWTIAVLVLTGFLIVTAELLPLFISQALIGS